MKNIFQQNQLLRTGYLLLPVALIVLGLYSGYRDWVEINSILHIATSNETNVTNASQINQILKENPISFNSTHLFGNPSKPPESKQKVKLEKARKSDLKLNIKGIYSTKDQDKFGYVLIQEQGGGEKVYSVGDTLPGNAKVLEIRPGQVYVLRRGQHEVIEMTASKNLLK